MIKIKLLITTGLLVLLVPILNSSITKINLAYVSGKHEVLALETTNEITQSINPAQVSKQTQVVPASQSAQDNQQVSKPSGFCVNVPILMYHHIQPQSIAAEKWQTALSVDSVVFDSQMAYLSKSGYNTISVDQLTQALITHQKLPAKSIVLTFDDGYQDFYTFAFPIIKKYNLRANLFISTGLLENQDYQTWSQLKETVSSNQIFAYNHTWSHRNLGSASKDVIEREILTAKSQLETNLGKSDNIFAYPYGIENSTIINILRENGFIAAISTYPGTIQCDSFIMSLHRTRIGNSPLSNYGI